MVQEVQGGKGNLRMFLKVAKTGKRLKLQEVRVVGTKRSMIIGVRHEAESP